MRLKLHKRNTILLHASLSTVEFCIILLHCHQCCSTSFHEINHDVGTAAYRGGKNAVIFLFIAISQSVKIFVATLAWSLCF